MIEHIINGYTSATLMNNVIVFYEWVQSFDECVSSDGLDCNPKDLWLQIPFFCGQHAECWSVSCLFTFTRFHLF